MKKGITKAFSILLTLVIIETLILAGPAAGFALNLDVSDDNPDKGDALTFTADIIIDQNEIMTIDEIILDIDGPKSIECKFDIDGAPISGCSGLTIEKALTNEPTFGYGYGYGYGYGLGYTDGELTYIITLNTNDYSRGRYSYNLLLDSDGKTFSKHGGHFTIGSRKTPSGSSSSCDVEWSCSTWSACDAYGAQTRTCSRPVTSCGNANSPELIRECPATSLPYNKAANVKTISGPSISGVTSSQLSNNQSTFDNFHIIVVLLLLNSILSVLSIIIKVDENNTELKRKLARFNLAKMKSTLTEVKPKNK